MRAFVDWAATRFGFLAANMPVMFGPYARHPDIAYGDDPQQRLDVYHPSEPAAVPRPVVVFWHGGRWKFGDKRQGLRDPAATVAGWSGVEEPAANKGWFMACSFPRFLGLKVTSGD
jgi:acetyl esterase/lipase